MIAIRLHTGRVISDTRRQYEDPPQEAVMWEDTGTITVRVDCIIGVVNAPGPAMVAMDPRPAAVCVQDMGNLIVSEPMDAIEVIWASPIQHPGIWQWDAIKGEWRGAITR